MEGKPTARKLAPVISSYIRGLSDEAFHTTDRERKETLAAAWELDQIWGAWNDERTTEERGAQWTESMPEDSHDIRNQITASIIRHQRCWEPPFRSQLADDPQVLPDAGLKAQVGRDLFLDDKLPRGAGGQGYVAVTETSIVWKESRAAEVFTYQGLTSCMEPGEMWTIAGSIWHHLSKCTLRLEKELRALIYQEVNYQNQVEAEGYRSPTWRMLRIYLEQGTYLGDTRQETQYEDIDTVFERTLLLPRTPFPNLALRSLPPPSLLSILEPCLVSTICDRPRPPLLKLCCLSMT
jgi:hypothetical protein